MMRQDRFTQQAQEVLAASQEMVRTQRHSQWDVEHVLLALLQHQDGLAGRILDRHGRRRPRPHARASPTRSRKSPKLAYDVVQVYTTPRIVKMLETANAEAERLKDEYVGVEHLLIAIADERDGDAGAHPARVQHRQGAHLPRAAGGPRQRARRLADRREQVRRAREVQQRPHEVRARRQARPGDRPRPSRSSASCRSSTAARRTTP